MLQVHKSEDDTYVTSETMLLICIFLPGLNVLKVLYVLMHSNVQYDRTSQVTFQPNSFKVVINTYNLLK